MILNLFRRGRSSVDPYPLYDSIVSQARSVAFYRDLDVDDTLDGRFDMITLHAVLAFDALSHRGQEAVDLSQATFDLMFKDMDRSLREIGVGDVSIPKKVKKMGEVFFGRSDAYRKALAAQDRAELATALHRNVYASTGGEAESVQLADYAMRSAEALRRAEDADFYTGQLQWPHIFQDQSGTRPHG